MTKFQLPKLALLVACAGSIPAAALAQTDPVATSSVTTTATASQVAAAQVEAAVVVTGIAGRVIDAKTGEGLIEATVKVQKGGKGQALTDVDGNFVLPLPPGTYELRVFYELYQGRKIGDVRVEAGKSTTVDVGLTTDASSIEEIVVESKADTRKEAAVLQERRRATTLSDAISAEEIAKSPDSSASDAVKRVVSVTILDSKYVVIRGLGGRYATTLLNGVKLPSPEPDEPQAPLDLFPASLLANLTVAKSYDPELPGNFAGGALSIETNSYPSKFELRLKASTSGDTVTTFRDGGSYSGGSLDFLGFDDGSRSLPDAVPTDRPVRVGEGLDAAALEKIGESFDNNWTHQASSVMPNLGLGLTLGDTTSVAGKRLGYLGTLSFNNRHTLRRGTSGKVRCESVDAQCPSEMITQRELLDVSDNAQQAVLGGLLNFGLQLSSTDELNFFTLYTHQGESRVIETTGLNETDNQSIDGTRLQFIARQVSFNQLVGRHRFPDAGGLEVDWQSNVSVTNRSEPDLRDITYQLPVGSSARFKTGPNSGERFYSDLFDASYGANVGAALPTSFAKLSAGLSGQRTARDFAARRFRYAVNDATTDTTPLFRPAETIFMADSIGTTFRLVDATRNYDFYSASLDVLGGYAKAEVPIVEDLRIIGGARAEYGHQQLESGGPLANDNTPVPGTNRSDFDLMPSLSAVYALSPEMNLRAAYSYTLTRPQFRELAPFLYFDFNRRRSITGNPELLTTRIHNADLRWEWFRGEGVLAASVFYKRFVDPIEFVVEDADQGDMSYANAAQADVYGAELEARSDLGFVDKSLSALKVGANLTLLDSKVDLSNVGGGPQSSTTRPLQGQSPYVVNLNAGYRIDFTSTEINLLYNVFGARLAEVGADRIPDTYETPFHRFDVNVGQDLGGGFGLKLSATNLFNQAVRLSPKGSDRVVQEYHPGVAMMAALEWAQ